MFFFLNTEHIPYQTLKNLLQKPEFAIHVLIFKPFRLK